MAPPCTLPTVSTIEFEDFQNDFLLFEEEYDTMKIPHGPGSPRKGGSGRIEDASGESPAASLLWELSCVK